MFFVSFNLAEPIDIYPYFGYNNDKLAFTTINHDVIDTSLYTLSEWRQSFCEYPKIYRII